MKDNTPLTLEMVIFDPNSPPDTPPIKTHIIHFHTEQGRSFMNKAAMWAWQNGQGVATRKLPENRDRVC